LTVIGSVHFSTDKSRLIILTDPARFVQSYNRYSYAINNLLKYTDPSGHTEVSDSPLTKAGAALLLFVRCAHRRAF
jgi:hypothetical protein